MTNNPPDIESNEMCDYEIQLVHKERVQFLRLIVLSDFTICASRWIAACSSAVLKKTETQIMFSQWSHINELLSELWVMLIQTNPFLTKKMSNFLWYVIFLCFKRYFFLYDIEDFDWMLVCNERVRAVRNEAMGNGLHYLININLR